MLASPLSPGTHRSDTRVISGAPACESSGGEGRVRGACDAPHPDPTLPRPFVCEVTGNDKERVSNGRGEGTGVANIPNRISTCPPFPTRSFSGSRRVCMMKIELPERLNAAQRVRG